MKDNLNYASEYLHAAELNWKHKETTKDYAGKVCRNLQQSIEHALQFVLDQQKGYFTHTHDIQKLIDTLRSLGIDPVLLSKLEAYAKDITIWYAKSQTGVFEESDEKIKSVGKIARELLHYAEAWTGHDIEDGAMDWCRAHAPSLYKNYDDYALWAAMKDLYYREFVGGVYAKEDNFWQL